MADELVYRVIIKEKARRPADLAPLRPGDPVWLFGTKGAPAQLWRVDDVLPAAESGDAAEIVVDLWTGEPPRLA